MTASERHHGESQTFWLDSLYKQLSAEFDSLEFWVEPVPVVEKARQAKSASLKSQSHQVTVHAESAATIDSALHKENDTSNVVIKEEKVSVAKPPDGAWLGWLALLFLLYILYKGMG